MFQMATTKKSSRSQSDRLPQGNSVHFQLEKKNKRNFGNYAT